MGNLRWASRLCAAISIVARSFSLSTAPKSRRVALITGGNKGIGKETARRLGAIPGLVVIVAARDEALGEAAAVDLRSHGYDASHIRLELNDEESIFDTVEFVRERFGALDLLINNAAVCFNDPTLYGKVPHTPFESQADITIGTNFFGTLSVTQAMLPLLLESASPRIINIASAAGRLSILRSDTLVEAFTSETLTIQKLVSLMNSFVSDVEAGVHSSRGWPNTCYGVSKLGIIALTRILAREYPNIMINSVDPGYCRTDQNDNQGCVDPKRGAMTPFLLATLNEEKQFVSGGHFFEEQRISWEYQ